MDEQLNIDKLQYFFALEAFANKKDHFKENKKSWERVIDRFTSEIDRKSKKNLMYKVELPLLNAVVRFFSQMKGNHNIDEEKIKEASIRIQREFI